MTITDTLLTPGLAHGRPGKKLDGAKPAGIAVHYVGNAGSSAMGNRNYFQNGSGGNGVSAHFIIGLNGEILRCLPDDEVGYHAGRSYGAQWDATAKTANSKYIGIECCHPGADGKFSDKTYASLVDLAASLCKKYGFGINQIFRHYSLCGKNCPLYYVKNPDAWQKLLSDITLRLNGMQAAAAVTAPITAANPAATAPSLQTPVMSTEPSDWAKESWDWAKSHGYNDGTRPRDNATREELVAFIWRVLTKPGGMK